MTLVAIQRMLYYPISLITGLLRLPNLEKKLLDMEESLVLMARKDAMLCEKCNSFSMFPIPGTVRLDDDKKGVIISNIKCVKCNFSSVRRRVPGIDEWS